MTRRRQMLFGLVLLTLSLTGGSVQAQGDLSGVYEVSGTNPDPD